MASEDKLSKVKIPDRPFILNMPPVETGGCSIVMVGSTRSGKSTALKHVLDTYFSKHVGVLFSQSIPNLMARTCRNDNVEPVLFWMLFLGG
jgi:hypothetical protein